MASPYPDTRHRQGDPLWAVTAYFNPAGYTRRLTNYHAFRQHLSVPLVTVELSFDGSFHLRPGDAEILVQLDGGDIMWQKERLLNIALQHLPPRCDSVAWLDCDVIFERDEWAPAARRALDEVALVQLFHERMDLLATTSVDTHTPWDGEEPYETVLSRIIAGDASPTDLAPRGRQAPGLAWAARRDVLEANGLYDACILGGADRAILCAALGTAETAVQAARMNPCRTQHYLAWAGPFGRTVRARVGYVPGRIFHLWHGDHKDRQYVPRHALLTHFDPFTDIALDPQGCWRWSSDKPELHAGVRAYFDSRHEDGQAGSLAPGVSSAESTIERVASGASQMAAVEANGGAPRGPNQGPIGSGISPPHPDRRSGPARGGEGTDA